MKKQYVVTVARGFGSGGKQIAAKLADSLGIECYEHRILAYASQKLGVGTGEVMEVEEKLRGPYFAMQLSKLQHTIFPRPVTENFVSDDELFACQADIIRRLAETGPCVIVGKCADDILKDMEHVISVYIEAPRPFCRRRIMDRMNVSAEEADRLIEKTDKYRSDYYKYYTHGKDWRTPASYDLILNSQRVGVENCVQVIRDYLRLKQLI